MLGKAKKKKVKIKKGQQQVKVERSKSTKTYTTNRSYHQANAAQEKNMAKNRSGMIIFIKYS